MQYCRGIEGREGGSLPPRSFARSLFLLLAFSRARACARSLSSFSLFLSRAARRDARTRFQLSHQLSHQLEAMTHVPRFFLAAPMYTYPCTCIRTGGSFAHVSSGCASCQSFARFQPHTPSLITRGERHPHSIRVAHEHLPRFGCMQVSGSQRTYRVSLRVGTTRLSRAQHTCARSHITYCICSNTLFAALSGKKEADFLALCPHPHPNLHLRAISFP